LVILAAWAAHLVILGALQARGADFVSDVWPLGEDRGLRMTRLFWSVDGRNPLSPWWYLVASLLILAHDSGLYLIRKLVDPLLAVSAFLLFDRVTDVLWFTAFATHTLQSGAILAIALLAFIRAPASGARQTWAVLRARALAAVSDAWPYDGVRSAAETDPSGRSFRWKRSRQACERGNCRSEAVISVLSPWL
jgi:hypothetical protein